MYGRSLSSDALESDHRAPGLTLIRSIARLHVLDLHIRLRGSTQFGHNFHLLLTTLPEEDRSSNSADLDKSLVPRETSQPDNQAI